MGPLFDPLSGSGATEGGLLYIGCNREDLTISPILLETNFHFDVGEETWVV